MFGMLMINRMRLVRANIVERSVCMIMYIYDPVTLGHGVG